MGKFQRKYTLFLDATVNKVDAKGRVSIPADYRALLEQQETELVAFRSFTMPCIECRTSEMMEKMADDDGGRIYPLCGSGSRCFCCLGSSDPALWSGFHGYGPSAADENG